MHPKKLNTIIPGKLSSIRVVDGNVEMALRNWKKMLKENKTIESCYDQKFYVKPSDSNRLAKNTAVYLQQKEAK